MVLNLPNIAPRLRCTARRLTPQSRADARKRAPLISDYKDFPASAMVAEMTKEGRTASL